MDKILNPTTGRYVKKNSPLGKKIANGYIPPEKQCKSDYVKNPKTKRCVKKTGKLGQQIMATSNPNEDILATKIQAAIRGKIGRRKAKETNATKTLQSVIRRTLTTNDNFVVAPEYTPEQKIQAVIRRTLATNDNFVVAPEYTPEQKIQAAIRGKIGRRKAKEAKETNATKTLQSAIRRTLATNDNFVVPPQYTEQENASINTIQQAIRGKLARNRVDEARFAVPPQYTEQEIKKKNKLIKTVKLSLTPSQANIRQLIKNKSMQNKIEKKIKQNKIEKKDRQNEMMNKIKNTSNPFYKETGVPKSSVNFLTDPIIVANAFLKKKNTSNPFYKETAAPTSSVNFLPMIAANAFLKKNKQRI